MKFLLKKFIDLQGPKYARQAVTAGVGAAAAAGFAIDASTLETTIISIILIALTALWSAVSKAPVNGETKPMLNRLALSLASQVIPFISGWLATHGLENGASATPEAALLFAVNAGMSGKLMPDKKSDDTPPKDSILNSNRSPLSGRMPLVLFLMCLSSLALSSCNTVRNAIDRARINAAFSRPLLLLAVCSLLCLPSCINAKGADWQLTSALTNLEGTSITAAGMSIGRMDQGTPLKDSVDVLARFKINQAIIGAAGSAVNSTIGAATKLAQ